MIYALIVAMIVIGIIFIQDNHYAFVQSQVDQKNVNVLSEELELKMKEFDDYKKKVDALVLRAGFKL